MIKKKCIVCGLEWENYAQNKSSVCSVECLVIKFSKNKGNYCKTCGKRLTAGLKSYCGSVCRPTNKRTSTMLLTTNTQERNYKIYEDRQKGLSIEDLMKKYHLQRSTVFKACYQMKLKQFQE